MLKLIKGLKVDHLRNTFLNLAIPNMMMSEPGEPPVVKLREDLKVSLWDRWEVKGFGKWTTLAQVFKHIKDTYKLTCRDVMHESTSILMHVMMMMTP